MKTYTEEEEKRIAEVSAALRPVLQLSSNATVQDAVLRMTAIRALHMEELSEEKEKEIRDRAEFASDLAGLAKDVEELIVDFYRSHVNSPVMPRNFRIVSSVVYGIPGSEIQETRLQRINDKTKEPEEMPEGSEG